MTPKEAAMYRWLCQMYNARGALNEEAWLQFARFCVEFGFDDEPLPGKRVDGLNPWDVFELKQRGITC